MSFICPDCHAKLYRVWEMAHEEFTERLDKGDDPIALLVEYKNEQTALMRAGEASTERYYFLDAIEEMCASLLANRAVTSAGWTKDCSGLWVQDEAAGASSAKKKSTWKTFGKNN